MYGIGFKAGKTKLIVGAGLVSARNGGNYEIS